MSRYISLTLLLTCGDLGLLATLEIYALLKTLPHLVYWLV